MLLAVLGLNFGGLMVFEEIERWMLREQFEANLSQHLTTEYLTTFHFTPGEFEKIAWEEENEEFWLDDTLYDVVQIQKNSREITIFCLSDKDETTVVNFYAQLKNTNPGSPSQKQIIAEFWSRFILYPTSFIVTFPFINGEFPTKQSTNSKAHYQSIELSILSPPPQHG